ncbi:MAG: cell division topological specificity factor MinE [Bdellovibrionales bacterium]|nr:cell division topological specificity factor MinE [Bdellovibrionales bacterium]
MSWLSELFNRKNHSKSLAKSRLHFVLVQDRTGLTNEEMARFKSEMVEVVERYFVIDKHAFDIEYRRDSDLTTLVINSPIVVRRQEGQNHDAGKRQRNNRRSNQKQGSDKAQSVPV